MYALSRLAADVMEVRAAVVRVSVGQPKLRQDLIGVLAKLGRRPGRQPFVGTESKRRTDGPVPTETRMVDLAGEAFRHGPERVARGEVLERPIRRPENSRRLKCGVDLRQI